MANYETLKSAIQQVVKTNGNNEITGALLQQSLLAMINSLGAGYQFMGIASLNTTPGTPDNNVFYIVNTPGNYSNFGGLVVNDGEIAIFVFNGQWAKLETKIANVRNVGDRRKNATGEANIVYDISNDSVGTKYIVQVSGTTFSVLVYAMRGGQPTYVGEITNNTPDSVLIVEKTANDIDGIRLYNSLNTLYSSTLIINPFQQTLYENQVALRTKIQEKVRASDFYGVEPPKNLWYENASIGGYLSSGGGINSSTSYKTSDFIPVGGNENYKLPYARFVAEYDAKKTFISGSYKDLGGYTKTSETTTQSNAKYIRVTFFASNSFAQICKDSLPNEYEPYRVRVPFIESELTESMNKAIKIDTNNFKDVEPSANLLRIDNMVSGYLGSNGAINANPAYKTSYLIAVEPSTSYHFSGIRFALQYDTTKVVIANTYSDLSLNDAVITTSSDTRYIRVTASVNTTYRAMIVKGSAKLPYEPYSVIVPFIRQTTMFTGKRMVCFGDSITACVAERDTSNWCMYVAENLGMITTNQGYWSGRIAATGGSPVVNAFSLPRLVDSILSGDWSVQDIIYETTGYEQHAQQVDKLKQIDFSQIDYVSISLGTNDLSSDTPFEIEGEPLNENSVNGAFRYCISRMLTAYPHLKFIIATPIYRFTPSTGDDYINNGRGIQDFVNDYKTLGAELRIPVVNMFNDISVNKYNRVYYWGTGGGDGLHPNANMKQVMGNKMTGAILSMF